MRRSLIAGLTGATLVLGLAAVPAATTLLDEHPQPGLPEAETAITPAEPDAQAEAARPASDSVAKAETTGRQILSAADPAALEELEKSLPPSVKVEERIKGDVFTGLVVTSSSSEDLAQLAENPDVGEASPEYVYRAGSVRTSATVGSKSSPKEPRTPRWMDQMITPRSWGIDRIDQRNLPLDRRYSSREWGKGRGATVYVIDSGIARTKILKGRVKRGKSFIRDGRGTRDCSGHGTHIAGTIAGKRGYGVAPKAKVRPVRAFGCEKKSLTSTILRGINWVAKKAKTASVANLSFGSNEVDPAFNAAVQRLIDVRLRARTALH